VVFFRVWKATKSYLTSVIVNFLLDPKQHGLHSLMAVLASSQTLLALLYRVCDLQRSSKSTLKLASGICRVFKALGLDEETL